MSISNKNGPASAFRAARPRPARRAGVDSGARIDPAAFASAPGLATLIARAWTAPEEEPQAVASIIELAVRRAREERDVRVSADDAVCRLEVQYGSTGRIRIGSTGSWELQSRGVGAG